MNYFTKISIDLANQKDYLDQLFKVYPLSPDSIRNIVQIFGKELLNRIIRKIILLL